jgi:NTP pyrophosphatase (non-canonical NTP hydrolase)
MNDRETTVEQLRAMIRTFVKERDWSQFHAPKNLAMALSIEAAELMEHFQWLGVDESRMAADDLTKRAEVGEEIADVICYALALAEEMKLDVASTMKAKMAKNAEKYPVEQYRGRYGPDDPNPTRTER